jgi:hypothetical protein
MMGKPRSTQNVQNSVQDIQVDCDVAVPDSMALGVYANAFRIVGEVGHDCFLDFAVYSADKQRAEVVARVRVHRSFLTDLHRRLGSVLTPGASSLPGDEGIFVMPGSDRNN